MPDAGLQPNIVVLVWDTARARTVYDELEKDNLPALGRLAGSGTSYRNAITTAPWTLPAHASLFTGQYTAEHGTHAGSAEFAPDIAVLPERLNRAGYETVGISANTWISPRFGFDRGFAQFTMKWNPFWDAPDFTEVVKTAGPTARVRTLLETSELRALPKTALAAVYAKFFGSQRDDGAHRITGRAVRWLRETPDRRPFFLFVNYLEPHLPYDPPDAYIPAQESTDIADQVNQDPWKYLVEAVEMSDDDFATLESLYRAEIRYLDSQVDRLIRELEDQGTLEETVFVVLGDHGENIGDNGLMDHQYSLHEPVIRVPLVVRYPERPDTVTEVREVVETRDLFPTLLSCAGIDVPDRARTRGVSTRDVRPDESDSLAPDNPCFAQYVRPQPSMNSLREKVGTGPSQVSKYDRALRAVRTDRWKLIEGSDGNTALYDLDSDATETRDVSRDNPETTRRLRDALADRFGVLRMASEESDRIDDRTAERLEDLGYLQ